ncbi:MAG: methyltransferase domain-containing protein [Planctomycetota bacterium]
MSAFAFFKNFLRQPGAVGAIAPSSPALVREMMAGFDWPRVRAAIEYGPGTGVFTEGITRQLADETKFFAIEQSAEMATLTRQRCPDVTVHHDSVINVARLCEQHGIEHVDAIVCGLPWAAFSDGLQAEIMDAMLRVLPPGGTFATFAYLQGVPLPAGQRFAKRLHANFSQVKKSRVVWRNLPPAFIYRCIR